MQIQSTQADHRPASNTLPSSLDEVLMYKNPRVVQRFVKEFRVSKDEAELTFQECLKWLYLCARHQATGPHPFHCMIFSETEKIDFMWHTFLLFTRDYANFCHRHFGFYIHHAPEDEAAPSIKEGGLEDELTQFFNFIYDELGEDTLRLWFESDRFSTMDEGAPL